MTELGNFYNIPNIELVDGVVTDATMLQMAYAMEAAFDALGDTIGNMHGNGAHNNDSKLINNLAATIGSLAHDIASPNGTVFSGYSQVFPVGSTKDYILDLIPSGNITINVPSISPGHWHQKASINDMQSDGDYSISGRILTFYINPSAQFTILYDGVAPTISTSYGYMPNIMPNQLLRATNSIAKPAVTVSMNGRYKVTVPEPDILIGTEYGKTVKYKLADYLQQYLSANGAIECPQSYIAIWKKDSGVFRKIDTTGIYIIDQNIFEFESTEEIELTDELAVSVANRSISQDVYDIFKLLVSHSHNGSDATSPVSHSSLVGLIPQSGSPNINYGGSNIVGNDHPQYFHREGFQVDVGTYNNAIIGDVLIGSVDPISQFNNITGDSRKLVFGSISSGHSFKRRSVENDLLMYSPYNGIAITYDNSSPDNYAVKVLDNKVGTTISGDLFIDTGLKSTIFRNGAGYANIAAKKATLESIDVSDNIDIDNDGALSIGPITFANVLSNIIVTAQDISNKIRFSASVLIDDAEIESATIDTLLVSQGSKILFGADDISTNNSYFTTLSDNTGAYYSQNKLSFNNTGRSTGFGFTSQSGDVVYGNSYSASANGGAATESDNAIYTESKDGKNYFILATDRDQISDGVTYTWKNTAAGKTRIDSLQDWPRANIACKDISARAIEVSPSNLTDKKGISFGPLNSIYVTGNSAPCPAGIMVVESQNGIVFSAPNSSADNCDAMQHAQLSAGNIQAFGNLAAEGNLSVIGDANIAKQINANEMHIYGSSTIDGTARFDGAAKFNGAATFAVETLFSSNINVNGGIKVANTVETQMLSVSSSANIAGDINSNGNLYVDGTSNLGSLTIENGAIINGQLRVSDQASFDGIVSYSNDVTFNANMVVKGSGNITGQLIASSLEVSSIAVFNGIASFTNSASFNSNVTINNAIISGDATIGGTNSSIVLNGNIAINTSSFSIGGPLDVYGELTVKDKTSISSSLSVGADLTVQSSALFNSSVDIAGVLKAASIEVSNGIEVQGSIEAEGEISSSKITVQSSAYIGGQVTADSIVATNGVTSDGNAESSLGFLKVNGGFSQLGIEDDVRISGNTFFGSNVTVQGEMNASNTMTIGSQAAGVIVNGNNVEITGDTGLISGKNASFDKMSGNNTNVPVPNVILQFAPNLISVISGQPFVSFESGVSFENKTLFSDAAIFADTIYATNIEFLGNPTGAINIVAKKAKYAD